MDRRNLSRLLLTSATAAAGAVFTRRASAQSCASPCYPRTAAEIAAEVTPVNYAYVPGDVRRHGAVGDGVANDTAAIQRCIKAQAQTNGGTVYFPVGIYKVTSGFSVSRSVQIMGEGSPSGGTGTHQEPCSIILSAFKGDLFTFTGSSSATNGSGGGVENMRLVQASGTRITPGGAGTAIKLIGTSTAKRPSWFKVRNTIIEYGVGTDSWTWGVEVDGTAITGGTILDLWFSQLSCHTASSSGGAMRLQAATAKIFDCAFYDVAGNVTITGIAGTPSVGVLLFNTDVSGALAFDWANDITCIGGTITTITNTENTGGQCTIIPGRLINPFTSSSNKAGVHFGLLRYDTRNFATCPGSFRISQALALENAQSVHGINSAGTAAPRLIGLNSSDRCELAGDGEDIQLGQGTIANGGGATPAFGTIGGSGPSSAPQAGWVKFFDRYGKPFWIPFWR